MTTLLQNRSCSYLTYANCEKYVIAWLTSAFGRDILSRGVRTNHCRNEWYEEEKKRKKRKRMIDCVLVQINSNKRRKYEWRIISQHICFMSIKCLKSIVFFLVWFKKYCALSSHWLKALMWINVLYTKRFLMNKKWNYILFSCYLYVDANWILSSSEWSGSVPFRRQITFALTRIALMYFDVN